MTRISTDNIAQVMQHIMAMHPSLWPELFSSDVLFSEYRRGTISPAEHLSTFLEFACEGYRTDLVTTACLRLKAIKDLDTFTCDLRFKVVESALPRFVRHQVAFIKCKSGRMLFTTLNPINAKLIAKYNREDKRHVKD